MSVQDKQKKDNTLQISIIILLITQCTAFVFTSLQSYFERRETLYQTKLSMIVTVSKKISQHIEYMRSMDRFHLKFDQKYVGLLGTNADEISRFWKYPFLMNADRAKLVTDSLKKDTALIKSYGIAKDSLFSITGTLQSAEGIFSDANTIQEIKNMRKMLIPGYYRRYYDEKIPELYECKGRLDQTFAGYLDDTLLKVRKAQLEETITAMREELN